MVQEGRADDEITGFLVSLPRYRRAAMRSADPLCSAMNSFFSLFILMINYGIGSAARGSSIQPWRAIHRTNYPAQEIGNHTNRSSLAGCVVAGLGRHTCMEAVHSEKRTMANSGGKFP